MTKRQLASLARKVAAELPGLLAVKGKLIISLPLVHTLKAVLFDGSSFDADLFFVHVFLQPLFVPAAHLVLNIGWRVGGGTHRWDSRDPGVIRDLVSTIAANPWSFLLRVRTPVDVAIATKSLGMAADPFAQEAVASAFARAGDSEQAIHEFNALLGLLDGRFEWQRVVAQRARALITGLEDEPAIVARQLESQEQVTAQFLNINEFRTTAE
jgi:hypothetical protein